MFERLLRSVGAELRVVDAPGRRGSAELERSGRRRRLAEVLALAEALPYRPSRTLRFPQLPAGAGR